ncbi:AP2/ERF and B3 domain-containing transcription factor [Senna tora]|uniref:AP2/ERF and B3 domain-containing transcription factor n=1 Tax=Senna tora TaxID=362788 RepID=A0A834X2F7_9FABA|nr:AP2/ERF and B3 domain-containing transcription factor [Senna tora]
MNGSSSNNNMQKFKGVVPQQNGHWGAQIYANHQRIWLGTFKSEREAAMAYDSATIKLRSGESHRNFPWNDQTVQEPHFQSHYTTEAILSMIRDGTYPSKFASFLISTQTQTLTLTLTLNNEDHHQEAGITRMQNNNNNNGDEEKFSCTLLFQKELTPSDVGKLNRLVIPKKHASRYFPYVSGSAEEGGDIDDHNNYISTENNNNNSDTELVFYDKLMRSWKFRYCYWRSSQSFVFTRGWNRSSSSVFLD